MIASFNAAILGERLRTSKNNLRLFRDGSGCNRALGVVKSPLPNHILAGDRRLQPPLRQFSNISAGTG
jgi:hypothetical protein